MNAPFQHRFLPHTASDEKAMLEAIGVEKVQDLFATIPASIRGRDLQIPGPLSEAELLEQMQQAADHNETTARLFLGSGAYEHFIPSVVWSLASRGEFLTAYTPYQPEVSQGTLQAAFEYQSLICELLAMDAANSSIYDGASALAEAVLMANRIKKRDRILLPETLHPAYARVVRTYVEPVGIRVDTVPMKEGIINPDALTSMLQEPASGVVVQQPNFPGRLEPVSDLEKIVHDAGSLLIASVYPTACAVLAPPGEYGADIACGEGQPLGLPLSFGGPYLGFLACAQKYIRQMPGRLIGQTKDIEGEIGYVLTLQTREQHIRREKSTSNICTNQFLCALASAIYLSTVGRQGLAEVARQCVQKSHILFEKLIALEGVEIPYPGDFFNEFVIRTSRPASEVLQGLEKRGIIGGLDLGRYQEEWAKDILVCATETRKPADLEEYAAALQEVLKES
jgi:glycine dehydrogenase subunit 1